jgi:hypothetical protein
MANQQVGEGSVGQVGHDEIGHPILFAKGVDGDDVGMIEGRGRVGFALKEGEKPALIRGRSVALGPQYFNGDRAIGAILACQVDGSHPAHGEGALDHAATQVRAEQRVRTPALTRGYRFAGHLGAIPSVRQGGDVFAPCDRPQHSTRRAARENRSV